MTNDSVSSLSQRQVEYLRLVLAGYQSKEIAQRFDTTPKAIDNQLDRARATLGVATRLQAARLVHPVKLEGSSPAASIPVPNTPRCPDTKPVTAEADDWPDGRQLGEARHAFSYDWPPSADAAREDGNAVGQTFQQTIKAALVFCVLTLILLLAAGAIMGKANEWGRALLPYIM